MTRDGSGVDDLLMSNVYRFDGERRELVERLIRAEKRADHAERSLRELVAHVDADGDLRGLLAVKTARIAELEDICARLNQKLSERRAS